MPEAAPLVSIPEAPIPPGTVAEWFDGSAGLRLRAALTPGGARGSVVVSPGRAEPIEKYFEVVGELAARGFTVLVHDWRGQGLSGRLTEDPLKGHAQGLRPFLDDYERLIGEFETRLPEPWIALGHSMGGLLNALSLIEKPDWFAGSILTAPMMGVLTGRYSTRGLLARATAARWLGQSARYLPSRTDPLAAPFEENILTHDEGRWRRFRAQLAARPDLRLGRVTWGWLELALKATAEAALRARAARIGAQMTVMLAEQEALVDNAAACDFAERVGARLVEVKGARHEILMETDPIRAVFWEEFDRLAGAVAPI